MSASGPLRPSKNARLAFSHGGGTSGRIYALIRLMERGSVSNTLSAAFDMVSLNVAVRFSLACRSYQAMSNRMGKLVSLKTRSVHRFSNGAHIEYLIMKTLT